MSDAGGSPLVGTDTPGLAVPDVTPVLSDWWNWAARNRADLLGQIAEAGPQTLEELRSAPGDLSNPMLMAFGGPGSIKGFHGTAAPPFDAFSNEFIGSGEGAQAFGWGHYVAGNPKVAEEYSKNLSGGGNTTIGGIPWIEHPDVNASNPHIQTAVNEINAAEGNTVRATDQLTNHAEMLNRILSRTNPPMQDASMQGEISRLNSARQWIVDNEHQIGWDPGGSLLEVHILPEESELLDWDRPLSGQPEGVQQAIQPLNTSHGPFDLSATGQDIYRTMSARAGISDAGSLRGPQGASALLHSAGIPGIRYLDAGSRILAKPPMLTSQGWKIYGSDQIFDSKVAAQQAADDRLTRNYVIFDPSNLRITARNGQRLIPVDHDPFAGEGSQ